MKRLQRASSVHYATESSPSKDLYHHNVYQTPAKPLSKDLPIRLPSIHKKSPMNLSDEQAGISAQNYLRAQAKIMSLVRSSNAQRYSPSPIVRASDFRARQNNDSV